MFSYINVYSSFRVIFNDFACEPVNPITVELSEGKEGQVEFQCSAEKALQSRLEIIMKRAFENQKVFFEVRPHIILENLWNYCFIQGSTDQNWLRTQKSEIIGTTGCGQLTFATLLTRHSRTMNQAAEKHKE